MKVSASERVCCRSNYKTKFFIPEKVSFDYQESSLSSQYSQVLHHQWKQIEELTWNMNQKVRIPKELLWDRGGGGGGGLGWRGVGVGRGSKCPASCTLNPWSMPLL